MHDSFCPLCRAKLKQKPLGWRLLWHPFPLFRCPSCATMLAWNIWTYALAVLVSWAVLLSPILLVSITPSQFWTFEQLLVVAYIQFGGMMMCVVTPVALYCLLPLTAKKISDE